MEGLQLMTCFEQIPCTNIDRGIIHVYTHLSAQGPRVWALKQLFHSTVQYTNYPFRSAASRCVGKNTILSKTINADDDRVPFFSSPESFEPSTERKKGCTLMFHWSIGVTALFSMQEAFVEVEWYFKPTFGQGNTFQVIGESHHVSLMVAVKLPYRTLPLFLL